MQQQPIQTISGTIIACNAKRSGTSAEGKAWTIFEVVINGDKFSTFDNSFQNMIGAQGTWNYFVKKSTGKNGQTYYNKTLVPAEIKKDIQQPQPLQQTSPIAGAPTPLAYDKEKTSKQIVRMNALTNSIKFLEGKPVDELIIMTTAERFYKWITDENYAKGANTPTSESDEDINIETALDEVPFK